MKVKTLADILLNQSASERMKDTARRFERTDPHIAATELEELALLFRQRSLKLIKGDMPDLTRYGL